MSNFLRNCHIRAYQSLSRPAPLCQQQPEEATTCELITLQVAMPKGLGFLNMSLQDIYDFFICIPHPQFLDPIYIPDLWNFFGLTCRTFIKLFVLSFLFKVQRCLSYKGSPSGHLTIEDTWQGTQGQEDPLEKKVATHSSILTWKIPRTERSLVGYTP